MRKFISRNLEIRFSTPLFSGKKYHAVAQMIFLGNDANFKKIHAFRILAKLGVSASRKETASVVSVRLYLVEKCVN